MDQKSSPFTFPEVHVVEASAGSGKTFALAKRYVQLLLNPAWAQDPLPPRSILAITFTNKAAYEMKARILDFLKKTALQTLNDNEIREILTPLGIDPPAASRRAFAVMGALIRSYNFFQVQTVDSFINTLLSGCSFKVGLSANFRIKTNAYEYLTYNLDRLIDRAAGQPGLRKIFDAFLHQYIYLENKNSWFPKKDILTLLNVLYKQGNFFGLGFIPSGFSGQDVFTLKGDILKLMNRLREEIPDGTDGRFLKSLEKFLDQYKKSFDIDRVSDYFGRDELPTRKGIKVPPAVDRLWRTIRRNLRCLSEIEARSLFDPYIEIFTQTEALFRQQAVKDDVLFLEELNKKARALFDEGAMTVEELYSRLATRFRHYLVDEFQDNSVLQWQNLYLMVEEALSTGGSLFYVGDKKQAIYGFRGGEAGLFEKIKQDFSHYNVRVQRLEKNYRSRQAIVEFNNRIFSLENLRRFIAAKEAREKSKRRGEAMAFGDDDYRKMENVFETSQQIPREDRPGGYVKIEYIDENKKEERQRVIRERLTRLIRGLHERFAYRDMAILTRDNKDVETMTAWLLEEGLFVESERTLNIQENPLIREIMALLRFLYSPVDNVAFAEFIMGVIFKAFSGIPSQDIQAFLFGLRGRVRKEKNVYLYKEFRDQFPDVWQTYFSEFFKNVGLYPLYEMMLSVVSRLMILENFPRQQAFVMRFLEIIKAREDEFGDIASFLENFENLGPEDLYVNVSDSDAIRILTIHKAKGLEFPVVIIPLLAIEVKVGAGGMGAQSFLVECNNGGLELLRIKQKYLAFSSALADIYQREYVKSFLFELNNLYVALTRAAEELYVFIPARSGTQFNDAQLLIPEDAHETGSPADGAAVTGKIDHQQARSRIPLARYQDWINVIKDEFRAEALPERRAQIRKGDILHAMLSFVGWLDSDGKNMDAAVTAARKRVEAAYPDIADFDGYETILKRVLSAETFQPFFTAGDGDVYQEKDIVTSRGETRRVDRLIVKDKEVWVIDYKSSRPADKKDRAGYEDQVRKYMGIVKEIYPGRCARGFLLYLDALKVKEII